MADQDNTLMTAYQQDLLRINIEASIRCGKADTGALRGFYALAGNTAWAAYRLLGLLHEVAPDRLAEFLPELIEEENDGDYLGEVDEIASALGLDVTALADRVRAEYETAKDAR